MLAPPVTFVSTTSKALAPSAKALLSNGTGMKRLLPSRSAHTKMPLTET